MFASKPMEAGRMLEVRLMELEADEFGEFLSVTYPGRQQLTGLAEDKRLFHVVDSRHECTESLSRGGLPQR